MEGVMRYIRRAKAYLENSEIDIRERIFMFLAAISIFGLVLAGVSGPIIGENIESIIFCWVAFVLFLSLTVIGFKTGKVIVVSYIVAFILVSIHAV
jgi:hypothetical protein